MNDQELTEFKEALEQLTQEHAASPETARRSLVDAGILTEDGELAEPYR